MNDTAIIDDVYVKVEILDVALNVRQDFDHILNLFKAISNSENYDTLLTHRSL
jgi:hypothetical protein